ncbi:carboxyl-terminal-processing peptidase 1, chloroplastic isoform X2 [Physcomitrium patens]|uniref:carboxyl-terminal-processing peptidase 1, chloroplastic isoform X2 n=1 Tax=Physcomitrium patens TaxID=3218 RepID=UPI000D15B540|nr:carboxyl-terminal-processing peptidase 1, chloroplastic-like isoform X2 [Physcomitrium patens]|eukprot:XP_024376786.1 carboxyl-terminal-processing peptidase 1, chloroplastic-like isoform X2 [Physcomitrella patens]
MAAVISTALPHLVLHPNQRFSLLYPFRKRVPTRVTGRSWLRKCRTGDLHNLELFVARRGVGIKACVANGAEAGTLSKTLRDAGVGLLASLITLASSACYICPALGFEAGRTAENSADYIWEAPSTYLIRDEQDSVSVATSHNEIAVLEAVAENVTLPNQCTEEEATSLVPKEEPVQEVTNESIVEEVWQVVNENFLDARHNAWTADDWQKKKQSALKNPIQSRMAAYRAIRTMLSSLDDRYTRFLTLDQFSQLSKYDVTGIGLNIGESTTTTGEPNLKVLGIVLGSPAQLVGIRQGDEILEVAGNSVIGKTAFEAASLIQGPKGTKIRHGQCGTPEVFEVERQQDVRSPVYYRLERIQDSNELSGYIHLKEFNARAKRDIVTAIKRMQDAGASSFVLDLRDNPGGLVQAGIEIAKLFLNEGETVIETVGRDANNTKRVIASHSPVIDSPLTILVNDHTASASEIVAAALHDNCRAVLVGQRTFGKGLIQAVYELSDGSGVVLTVGKYVTPKHLDIDGAGIEPDYKQPPGLNEGLKKLGQCKLLKT